MKVSAARLVRAVAAGLLTASLVTSTAAAQDASPAPFPVASPAPMPVPSPGRSPTPVPLPPSPTPGPGAAEVALCEDEASALLTRGERPLIALRAGSDVPMIDSGTLAQLDGPRSGSAGCRAPKAPFENPFADGSLDLFTISDLGGDGPLDIVRTRWGEMELTRAQARELDRDERIVVVGRRSNVLKAGRFQAICVELAADPIVGDTIHVATDVEDDPFRRVPSAQAGPSGELSNIRDVTTLYLEDGGPRLFSSDLSTGEWYTGERRGAAILDGRQACFLLPTAALGADFRPVTYRPGDAGGYDTGGLGTKPGLLATSGTFGWIPGCIEQLLVHEPLVLEDVEVSLSTDWVTFCFSASDADLDGLIDFVDDEADKDGVARGAIRFTLHEDGQENEQDRPLEVWIDDEGYVYFAFPIGLKAYGFHALADVQILPTGDKIFDGILEQAAAAIGRQLNPTTFDATPGRLQGDRECAVRPGSVR